MKKLGIIFLIIGMLVIGINKNMPLNMSKVDEHTNSSEVHKDNFEKTYSSNEKIAYNKNASNKKAEANMGKLHHIDGERSYIRNINVYDEQKEYIGQALNTIKRGEPINIYKEKDIDSKIIKQLKNYDEVKLLKTLPYGWYEVELEDGIIGYVDARYIRAKEIPPHNYDEKSRKYVIVFKEQDQTVSIYENGKLKVSSIASSGTWDNFTPKGIFSIEKDRRGEWSYVPRFQLGFKYWVGFKGSYLIHSIPYTEDGKIMNDEAEKLGTPASHGCIRVPVSVAKYIYENIPDGALVIID